MGGGEVADGVGPSESGPDLGGDQRGLPFQCAGDQEIRIAVERRGVQPVEASVEGGMDRPNGRRLIDIAPAIAPDRPAAKADDREREIGSRETTALYGAPGPPV